MVLHFSIVGIWLDLLLDMNSSAISHAFSGLNLLSLRFFQEVQVASGFSLKSNVIRHRPA